MFPRLVVFGLGNPGPRYTDTRHNVGFRVADRLAARHGVAAWERARSYVASVLDSESGRLELVKPQTFMNLSGRAVREYCEEKGVPATELLVVVDDIALPLGQLRLRRRGSDGGHNGLKSIIATVGTADFPRLRLGIGPVPARADAAEFVLDSFTTGEEAVVRAMIERAAECVEAVLREGLEPAMNVFNAPEAGSEGQRDEAKPGGEAGGRAEGSGETG